MVHTQNHTDTLAISPASVTNGATSAVNIDTLGADYATIRVALSNIATTGTASADGVTVKLTECDNTNTSAFVAISTIADRTAIKFGREIRYEVNTKYRKRYLRLSVIPGTSGVTNEPVTVAAFATLSRVDQSPASTSTMVAGTNDAVVIA